MPCSYIEYFTNVLQKSLPFNPTVRQRALRLTRIRFAPVPRSSALTGVCNPQLRIYDQSMNECYTSPWEAPGRDYQETFDSEIAFDLDLLVSEDVTVVCNHKVCALGLFVYGTLGPAPSCTIRESSPHAHAHASLTMAQTRSYAASRSILDSSRRTLSTFARTSSMQRARTSAKPSSIAASRVRSSLNRPSTRFLSMIVLRGPLLHTITSLPMYVRRPSRYSQVVNRSIHTYRAGEHGHRFYRHYRDHSTSRDHNTSTSRAIVSFASLEPNLNRMYCIPSFTPRYAMMSIVAGFHNVHRYTASFYSDINTSSTPLGGNHCTSVSKQHTRASCA